MSSWGAELREYERVRRREVDPAVCQAAPPRNTHADQLHKERPYNPLLQRFRDDGREEQLRSLEDRARTKHLNVAVDVQLRREHQYNLITHQGRLDPVQAPEQFHPPESDDMPRAPIPTTFQGHNIISNLSLDQHHWDHPDRRPRPPEQSPRARLVPREHVKEFNVVTNRYLEGHEEKTARDVALNRLEASEKFRVRNRFDPVKQRFNEPRAEENMRASEDAREVDSYLRAKSLQPLSYRGRETDAYDMIRHEVRDRDALLHRDEAEAARSQRYRTGHQRQQATMAEAAAFEEAAVQMRHTNVNHANFSDVARRGVPRHTHVAHERFSEVTRRGHNILSNCPFGEESKQHKLHQPMTTRPLDAWEKAQEHRIEDPPLAQSSRSAPLAGSSGRSAAATLSAALVGGGGAAASSAGGEALAASGSGSGARTARGPHRSAAAGSGTTPGSLVGSGRLCTPLSARASSVGSRSLGGRSAPPAPQVPGLQSSGAVYSQPQPF